MSAKTFFLVLFFSIGLCVSAQRVALKTNTLEWLTTTPNLGAEFVLNEHLSLDISGAFNPWKIKNYKIQHVRIQPELRYWFLRPMTRHFVGITAFYISNDIQIKNRCYYGDNFAGGVTYGYDFVLSERWNIELTAGVGVMYTRQFETQEGEPRVTPNLKKWMVVPVKLGVSFIYILR